MNTTTLDKMRQLKFFGMLRAFQTSLSNEKLNELTPDELISFLIESEWDDRHNRAIQRLIKNAGFKYKASLEDLNYDNNRNLNKNQILRFGECDFIKKCENILITGSTGIGKSYLASAIGHHACMLGFRVVYINTSKLFAKMKIAKADGSYLREMARMERQDLLILDDFGLQPLDNQNRLTLLELIEDRNEKGSVIITAQIPVSHWHEIIGESTVADAILDRIVHNAQRVELKGESLRKIMKANKNEKN